MRLIIKYEDVHKQLGHKNKYSNSARHIITKRESKYWSSESTPGRNKAQVKNTLNRTQKSPQQKLQIQ